MSDITNEAGGDDVMRLRAHAVGIARDIADAFAKERNDGNSSAALFRHLADHLLAEPELVRTIAAWHAAALHQVDGGKPHAAQPEAVAWRPIETAPQDGYLMCYEDGAYRLKLRHEGKWLDTAYAGIECAPWGDVAVGADAQRILDMRADAGRYKLVVRDGCCENPTHWMPLPEPPGLAAPPTEPQAAQQPEAYVFAGWQQRYIDPEEGPSSWQACQDSDVRLLQGRKDYELRKVYAATPPTEPAPALLVRDVAEMLCMDSVAAICKALVALGWGRVMSDAQSAAAVDALRDAELPQAVPGRARDLARKLRDSVEPRSWIADAWTAGMLADLLEQVANAWDRRPAAGMNFSKVKLRGTGLGLVVLTETARWSGGTHDEYGGWTFSPEAWGKFTTSLSADQPMEILTSPGVSAPESVVHQRCMTGGCQMPANCPQGKCVLGPGEQA